MPKSEIIFRYTYLRPMYIHAVIFIYFVCIFQCNFRAFIHRWRQNSCRVFHYSTRTRLLWLQIELTKGCHGNIYYPFTYITIIYLYNISTFLICMLVLRCRVRRYIITHVFSQIHLLHIHILFCFGKLIFRDMQFCRDRINRRRRKKINKSVGSIVVPVLFKNRKLMRKWILLGRISNIRF